MVVPAAARVGAGETMDVAFTPPHPGRFTLEVSSSYGVTRVTRLGLIVELK